MKCSYCNNEIPEGSGVSAESHHFCNELHRYYWGQKNYQDQINSDSDENEHITNRQANQNNPDTGMFNRFTPMNIGDIFSISFELIKNTFLRNIVISMIFLIPVGIILSYGMQVFFSTIANSKAIMTGNGESVSNFSQFSKMIYAGSLYSLAMLSLFLGSAAVKVGVIKVSSEEMEGNKISLITAFKEIFSVKLLRAIGIYLVIGFSVSIIVLIMFVTGVVMKMANQDAIYIAGTVFIIFLIMFTIFLYFRWYFGIIAAVHANSGVFKSLKISFALVKKHWWRTFGILLLVSIIVNFAIGLITTPVSFGLMWGSFANYFKMLSQGNVTNPNPNVTSEYLNIIGTKLGIVIIISTILQAVITPLFSIVMYFDLKIRKNHYDNVSKLSDKLV